MELMLPHGGTLARGGVIERKRDHKGNVIGRSNANLILDTREYEVKFEDGDVTELTANAISESMYAMCDENGDHILLFDAIVYHNKNDNAMTRAEHKFVESRGKQHYTCSTKLCHHNHNPNGSIPVLWNHLYPSWAHLDQTLFLNCGGA